MKNKTNEVDYHVYANTKAEELKQNTKKALAENVKQAGKRDAEENLPHPTGDNLSTYLDPELNALQQQVDDLRDLHRADETVQSTVAKHERDVQTERNKRDEISRKLTNKQAGFQQGVSILLAIFPIGAVLLLGLMEGLMSLQAIRSFIPNYIIALPVSIIFGGGLAILAHRFIPWFNSGKTKLGKLLRKVGLVAAFSIAFYGLGLLRSYQIGLQAMSVDQLTQGGIFEIADPQEALIYCLLSWIVFLPAVIISRYTPSKDEWISIFRRRTIKKEIKTLQTKLDISLAEIKRLNNEIENLKIWEESRNQTAKRDEQSAIRMIAYLKSLYIQSNLRHRTDKLKPDCFDKDFRFYLTLYFQPVTGSKTNSPNSNN